MVFKSVLLLISDHCSVASWAVQLHTNGLSSTWTVGPYWGTTKNANKNTAATSQSSGILTALSLTTWGCGSKVQLKGKVHWLRTWSCAYVACELELIHTWRTGIVQQCLHLLLVWRYLIMALGKCMLPINSIASPGTAQGKKTELQTWTRFAGELRFFSDVAVLIASLDTDCIFFLIFVYQIGRDWPRPQSPGTTPEIMHFSSCHIQTQAHFPQKGKARQVLFHGSFMEGEFLKSAFWMWDF